MLSHRLAPPADSAAARAAWYGLALLYMSKQLFEKVLRATAWMAGGVKATAAGREAAGQ